MTEAVKMWTLFAPDGSIVDWGPDKAGLLHVAHQGYATEAEAEAAVKAVWGVPEELVEERWFVCDGGIEYEVHQSEDAAQKDVKHIYKGGEVKHVLVFKKPEAS